MLVKVIAVDDQDRVKLSRKAALAERGQPDPIAETRPHRVPRLASGPSVPPRRDDRGDRGGRGDRGPRGPRDR